MAGSGVEIEYRFLIPDPPSLPALGRGFKIIQCYLPRWKLEIKDGNLYFEERVLVHDLPSNAKKGMAELIENVKSTPRIRLRDDRAFVTMKGPTIDYSRAEWEFEVMPEQVQDLVASYRFPYVVKKRYEIPADDGLIWEVDFFEGDNQGLVLAELEVPSADHEFSHPEWLGVDVTNDNRFGNGSLAREPWCDWSEEVLDLMPANQ